MNSEWVTIPISEDEKVSGMLAAPNGATMPAGIIIAHGAGNDMNHPLLQRFAEGLADAGYLTLRFNFLYREKGRKALDREDLLELAWLGAYRFLAEHPELRPLRIGAAGKSLGGRIASQMVASGKLPVDRLIFLGYPLHAPGKQDRLRDAHLYGIAVPMLFLTGSRDPFCDLEPLRRVLPRLKAPWKLEVIEGGDHSFNLPKSQGMPPEEIHRLLLTRTLEWLRE